MVQYTHQHTRGVVLISRRLDNKRLCYDNINWVKTWNRFSSMFRTRNLRPFRGGKHDMNVLRTDRFDFTICAGKESEVDYWLLPYLLFSGHSRRTVSRHAYRRHINVCYTTVSTLRHTLPPSSGHIPTFVHEYHNLMPRSAHRSWSSACCRWCTSNSLLGRMPCPARSYAKCQILSFVKYLEVHPVIQARMVFVVQETPKRRIINWIEDRWYYKTLAKLDFSTQLKILGFRAKPTKQ